MRHAAILMFVSAFVVACCAPERAPPPESSAPPPIPAPTPEPVPPAAAGPATDANLWGGCALRAPAPRVNPSTVDLGLRWLADHQSADGSWDGGVGATGLAVLAFLGAGETHQSGSFKETVKRGLRYLVRGAQDANGCFGPRAARDFPRDHAIAALAVVEAFGMTGSLLFREPAQRGVAHALTLRKPGCGWHRSEADGGALDVETTGWMVMLLKSAGLAEIRDSKSEIAEAVAEIDRVTDPATGRIGGSDGRLDTAVGVISRTLAGRTPRTDPVLRTCADAVLADAPAWSDATELRRIYLANLGMYDFGGARWRRWQEETLWPFGERQRREPEAFLGSWDPVGGDGGAPSRRVESTALGCLMFEVYYRLGDMENWRRDGEKWNE